MDEWKDTQRREHNTQVCCCGSGTVPEHAAGVARGGAGLPVAPGIPTWTKNFGVCPVGPVGFSFHSYGGASRL